MIKKYDFLDIFTKYTTYAKEYIQNVLPKKLSQLTNDVGYITKGSDISGTAAMAIADKDGNPITTTYEKKVDAQIALNKKADKATTLSGYGITDSYTKSEEDTKLKDKADAANVYTKQQVLDKLDLKADKAITLAGYYIGDAYTKTEIDTKLDTKANSSYVSGQFGTIKKSIDTINNNISENTNSIQTLRSDTNTSISNITTRISTVENKVSANKAAIDNINKQITNNQTSISSTYATKTELANKTKPATKTSLGTIIVGDNLTVDTNGRVSAKNSYVLPIATASVLGGIKQGTDITIDKSGILSVNYTNFTANCTEENFAKLYAKP